MDYDFMGKSCLVLMEPLFRKYFYYPYFQDEPTWTMRSSPMSMSFMKEEKRTRFSVPNLSQSETHALTHHCILTLIVAVYLRPIPPELNF
jgi:hypothetical protein